MWRIFAKLHLKPIEEVPVIMDNIVFHKFIELVPKQLDSFYVNILRKSGNFEILLRDDLIVSGKIRLTPREGAGRTAILYGEDDEEHTITKECFYKYCRLRNLNYEGYFNCVKTYNLEKRRATLELNKRFDCHMEGMLQLDLMNHLYSKKASVLKSLWKCVIDPVAHLKDAANRTGNIYYELITIFFYQVILNSFKLSFNMHCIS